MLRQQLRKRDTYTPTSAPQARSNCDPVFKQSFCSRDSEQDLKTFLNSPDEELTPRAQGGQNYPARAGVSVVYVPSYNNNYLISTIS